MKHTLFTALLLVSAGVSQAQTNNVGINTTSPGSSLTVAGSIGMPYRSVSASYTMTADDYCVSYTGGAGGAIGLPVAISGNGNFQGRIYRIRNASAHPLSVSASGAELISGNGQIIIPAGSIAELVSSGTSSGSTWQLMTASTATFSTDAIRAALSTGGCSSCAAYDAAAVNTWIPVTAGEYTAVSALGGSAAYGASDADIASPAGYYWGSNRTVGNSPTWGSVAGLYLIAFKTNQSGASTGIQLKVGSSTNGGYTSYGSSVNSAAGGVAYFVMKRPSATTGSSAYLGVYCGSANLGLKGSDAPIYHETGNATTLSSSSNGAASLQAIGTAARQW